jgi:hypothetical protein
MTSEEGLRPPGERKDSAPECEPERQFPVGPLRDDEA